jgi:hypothetical protein
MGSTLVIGNMKSNGCIRGIRKNATEFTRNRENDLSSLEQLLPLSKYTRAVSTSQSVSRRQQHGQ